MNALWVRAFLAVVCISACAPGSDPEEKAGALLGAAERGDVQSIAHLLQGDARVNARDHCRWTPLMKAALNGHVDAVRRLLTFGAAVDAEDMGGYTALMLAASNNHAEVLELLLQSGADIDHVETTRGWSALIWAAKRGNEEAVRLLLAWGADTDVRDFEGKTALNWANQGENPDLAQALSH